MPLTPPPIRTLSHLQAYLCGLPDGLCSYPDYLEKAAVNRQFASLLPGGVDKHIDKIPMELRPLMTAATSQSSWVPQVYAHALRAAMCDAWFANVEGFLGFCLDANRQLLGSPIYAFLFRLVSPQVILRGAQSRWTQLHKGIELTASPDRTPNRAHVLMKYPEHIVSEFEARTYAAAFQAAVALSGAEDATVRVEACTSTSATFLGTWK